MIFKCLYKFSQRVLPKERFYVHYEHCRIAIVRLKHIIGMLVIGKVS